MDTEKIIQSMEAFITEEDREILAHIEKSVLKNLRYGFPPEVMEILDDMDAPSKKIESIKDMLHQNILLRLLGIGNSVYYGKLRKGDISSFLEVVTRLGTDQTKIYILMFTLLELAKNVHIRKLLAKSIATSIISKILAYEFGLAHDSANRAELGGLMLQIGKMIILIYEEKEKEKEHILHEGFSEKFNAFLGLKVIKQFGLPDYLHDILLEDAITFEEKSFSIPTIVNTASLMASHIFAMKGKLFVKVPLPARDGTPLNHYGEIIKDWFRATGLNEYVEITETATEKQKAHLPAEQ